MRSRRWLQREDAHSFIRAPRALFDLSDWYGHYSWQLEINWVVWKRWSSWSTPPFGARAMSQIPHLISAGEMDDGDCLRRAVSMDRSESVVIRWNISIATNDIILNGWLNDHDQFNCRLQSYASCRPRLYIKLNLAHRYARCHCLTTNNITNLSSHQILLNCAYITIIRRRCSKKELYIGSNMSRSIIHPFTWSLGYVVNIPAWPAERSDLEIFA